MMRIPAFFMLAACLLPVVGPACAKPETVRLSADGGSFVLAGSGHPFFVWGVNYDRDSQGEGRLLEDYWTDEWEAVVEDFREMKELGANVIRIHLQLGKFMAAPEKPDAAALRQLERLLKLAEDTGIHLNLTGLGCYHRKDVPPWYDAMDETARWNTQAAFWTAIARTCRDSPAVFCYDLMNEPVISGKKEEGWLAGELGGKHYVQRLTLDPRGRSNIEIAGAWVRKLTAAIRSEDPHHLITVGVIPWAHVWPDAKPVFYSPEVAPLLDFVSIHLYPKAGKVDEALAAMKVHDIGKPLVIEETFPLSCSLEEMDDFLKRSKDSAEGYISFYWGRTIPEYEAATGKKEVAVLMAAWLRYFQRQAAAMKEAR